MNVGTDVGGIIAITQIVLTFILTKYANLEFNIGNEVNNDKKLKINSCQKLKLLLGFYPDPYTKRTIDNKNKYFEHHHDICNIHYQIEKLKQKTKSIKLKFKKLPDNCS